MKNMGFLARLGMTIPLVGLCACNSGSGNNSNSTPYNSGSISSMIRAAYIDTSAIGAVATIDSAGYKAANILIFGFLDPTASVPSTSMLSTIKTATSSAAPGTLNFVSIGGEIAGNITNVDTAINNIDKQIKSINSSLNNGMKITGVDLDLENGITDTVISGLAKGLKDKGYKLSVAPQVYLSSGTNILATAPSNIVLTSGSGTYGSRSTMSTYNPAISSGYIDYIFAQTYNTDGFSITDDRGSYSEKQVGFYKAVSKALGNTVKSDCSAYANSTTTTCIPNSTKIVIGTVANAGAASNTANIFGVKGSSYSQSEVLTQLKTDIQSMLDDPTSYPYFGGTMVWSLGNDYDPKDYGDSWATSGAFSQTIFGAGGGAVKPYFILQVSNTGNSGYGAITLVINNNYWPFGSSSNLPLAAGYNQMWGTAASAADVPGVIDSYNLDNIFTNGATSFTTTKVIINSYSSASSSLANPNKQINCQAGTNYQFLINHSYNIMFNPIGGECEIKQVL